MGHTDIEIYIAELRDRNEELEKALAYTERLLREAKKKNRATIFSLFKRNAA